MNENRPAGEGAVANSNYAEGRLRKSEGAGIVVSGKKCTAAAIADCSLLPLMVLLRLLMMSCILHHEQVTPR